MSVRRVVPRRRCALLHARPSLPLAHAGGNLSGKRVNFSGRTVISPNPDLPLYGVGVPLQVASILSYPERVTKHNIMRMKMLVAAGPTNYPGALTVRGADSSVRDLERLNVRQLAAQALQIGDTVDRHLQDGDIVLFNRQPSLHKMSIMCHRAVVLPGRTFRFNECVCTPYNADFDGDEVRALRGAAVAGGYIAALVGGDSRPRVGASPDPQRR